MTNPKPYADWTLDELYSYAAEKIPELAEPLESMSSYKLRHGAGFHALWVWMMRRDATAAPAMYPIADGKWMLATVVHSSEHHAIVAACLIAKGMEVPK